MVEEGSIGDSTSTIIGITTIDTDWPNVIQMGVSCHNCRQPFALAIATIIVLEIVGLVANIESTCSVWPNELVAKTQMHPVHVEIVRFS